MKREILVVGYGSIGKRHARNLIGLGITPYVLTKHPDKLNAKFLKNISMLKSENFEYCIISSPTARHLDDLGKCLMSLDKLKKILIEKPLEASYLRGKKIRNIARKYKLRVSVAYNLRFIEVFDIITKFIKEHRNKIRIVNAVAGQDLREWRPYKDVRQSYSAYREQGGGVDLDLSHEIDYILWLFGDKFRDKFIYRAKIGNLKISSPDIFKLVLDYRKFIVDITLDYIRKPKERYLRIICDNGQNLYYDFVTDRLEIDGKIILNNNDVDKSYIKMLKAFIDVGKEEKNKLCSIEEALNVLRVLEV